MKTIEIRGYSFEIRESEGTLYPYYAEQPGHGLNALVTYLDRGWKDMDADAIRAAIHTKEGFGDSFMIFESLADDKIESEHPNALSFIETVSGQKVSSDIWWITLGNERIHFYIPHAALLALIQLRDHLLEGKTPETFIPAEAKA